MKVAVGRRSLLLVDSKQAKRASIRFEQFFKDVIHRNLGELPSRGCLVVLCAMAFDVFSCKEQLLSYLNALSSRVAWGEREYVTWESAGEVHRRVPSVFTLLAARDMNFLSVHWEDTLTEVEEALGGCYRFDRAVHIGRRIEVVLNEGLAFFEHRLPRPLAAHIAGINHWSALPSRVWERQFSNVADPADTEDSEAAPFAVVSEAVIERLYEGVMPQAGSWFAQNLHNLCEKLNGFDVNLSDRQIRQELAARLDHRATELKELGPIEAILLGWVVDLVNFGSARKADPAVKTLSNYLRAVVMPLHAALVGRKRHPLSLGVKDWIEVFRSLLDTSSDPQTRPALSSFQRYLGRAHDAEPIPWIFRMQAEVRAPRANVLWPNEFDALPSLVTRFLQDERAVLQIQVWIALLRFTSMRIGELVKTSLRSITRGEDGILWVALAPAHGQPGLKSEAARRVMKVADPAAASLIASWVDRRKKEALASDELLFADPYRTKKVYRLGACYVALSRAMKQVTADEEITVHVTRHTFASFTAPAILQKAMTEFSEIRRLDELRVQMGHADLRTTFGTYCHLFEDTLRDCVDLIVQRGPIRTQDAAEWTGQPAPRLRQRDRSRADWIPWKELCDNARPVLRLPRVPELPCVAEPGEKRLTLDCVRSIAADWSCGMAADRISLRSGHGAETVDAVVRELERACAQLRIARKARKPVLYGWHTWFKDEANLARLEQPRWAGAMKILENTAKLSPDAVRQWLLACAGQGINGAHPAFVDVLWFLKDAGFSAEELVVRADDRKKAHNLLTSVRDVFAAGAQTELVTCRRGKPAAYVHLLTQVVAIDKPAASAACDMRSLRAVLMIGATYQTLARGKGESNER